MKRRGCLFTVIFMGFIVLFYGHPIWFPQPSSGPENTNEIRREPSPTSLNYEPIATNGFAAWIGKSLDDFSEQYGNPEETYSSGFSFMSHRYQMNDSSYLEVTSEEQKITSIKYLGGDDSEIAPFYRDMTMNDLTKITMVYPNFTMDYDGENIGFELMEDDMNYRPLIAFDNGSFAILFFNQRANESSLASVMYLSKDTLLKLSPYQLTDGKPPRFEEDEQADWEEINQSKQNQSRALFQFLRQEDNLADFVYNPLTQITADQVLADFFAQSAENLTTERAQKLKHIQNGELSGGFSASKTEMEEVLAAFPEIEATAYLELPVYDPTFTILSWYSMPYLHTRFTHETPESIGISFSKENMVILLETLENQTEESENY